MKPAQAYSHITGKVAALIAEASENDPDRAAYMVARAALLTVRARRGDRAAADTAYKLADELVSGETN